MQRPANQPPRIVVWLIPILLTLHNGEEAITFTAFAPRLQTALPAPIARMAAQLPPAGVVDALIALSAIAFVIALTVDRVPQSTSARWLLISLEAAVGLNALGHLLTAIFVFHGYGPGLITAVVLNLPFAVYCLMRAAREQWLSPAALRLIVPAALILHGPVLLAGLWLVSRLNR